MRADPSYAEVVRSGDRNDNRKKLGLSNPVLAGLLPFPGKQKILWVDDSSSLLSLYQAVFGSLGFEVTTTSSPQDALRHAGDVDIAILDYDMPDMNGAVLASLLKGSHRTLPVILYSGNSLISDAAHQWVDAICAKGAPREELLSTIDRLSRKRPSSGRRRLPEVFAPLHAHHSTTADVPVDVLPSSSESAACSCAAND
jgi:DNA-binding NtrC family response regulator